MNPQYILFAGKHPALQKENRQYFDKPKKSWNNYGASYSSDFFKLDIDDYNHKTGELEEPIKGKPRSEAVIMILNSLGIKFNGIRTEHGIHFFFRVPAKLERSNKINWYCPLGIRCEWKFPDKDDHIPLKINGIERKFFKGSITNTDLDELPTFLYPLQKSKDKKQFNLEFAEGNRTQHLGAYLFYLVKNNYSANQAFQIIRLLNDYIFKKPIPAQTLEAEILNASTLKKLQDLQQEKEAGKLDHADIAKEIADYFDLITVNGDLYNYENGVYKPFQGDKITKYMTEHYPKLKKAFELEVRRHITGITLKEIPEDDGTVNIKNGILQFSENGTITLLPHSKDYISFKQFNAAYDKNVKSQILDNALLLWFDNNSKQLELFNQLLGYLLMNHVNYQKVFFFIGLPSTGKSTILKLITYFCGKENVSAIQLSDFNKDHGLAAIVNKTANIFSDIRKTKVIASDVFKKLADGGLILIDQKYKQPFSYCYTGKLLFGMNSYPDFSQDFEGIKRRLVIFEFKHVFKNDDLVFDPAILESLTSDECMTALLNKAISGYQSLITNKGFISTKESEKALSDFVNVNDNIMQWLHESNDVTEDYLLREPIKLDGGKGSYLKYCEFCIAAGEIAKAQKEFSRAICQKFGFETYTRRVNKSRVQCFRKK